LFKESLRERAVEYLRKANSINNVKRIIIVKVKINMEKDFNEKLNYVFEKLGQDRLK
jgi:hypothetical protein